MHLLAPWHRTHSAVSSPLLSSDKIHSGSESQPSQQGPRTIPRYSFLIRLTVFVLLEFGFITLVVATLRKPIILHLSFTITEVKGAVTAMSILWHALAIYVVKDILLTIFSAEWIRQDDGSKSLTLRELDIVSRLTTGLIDQAKHFVSERATLSFRLGFPSSLLLILLNGLGPSAIGVNVAPYNYPDNVQIANLTIGTRGGNPNAYVPATRRAQSIIQLEMIENFTTLGYHATPPNVLIPWPSSNLMSENTTITYQSDVIRYNFSCSWNVPSFDYQLWSVADDYWVLYRSDSSQTIAGPIVCPLQRMEVQVQNFTSMGPEWGLANKSLMPFIFVAQNSTFIPKILPPAPGFLLNIDDIPTLNLTCNTTLHPATTADCLPLLVSILVCDPQPEVLPATINATASSLEATILPGVPTVKNIPIQAANLIFSTSLLDATSDMDHGVLNAISMQLFVPGLTRSSGGAIKPLSLQEINQNMNNALASSAKAYLSGYKPDYNYLTHPPTFATINTSAIIEVQKMVLVGSKPFLVASSVVVVLLVILLGVLVAITRSDQLEGFELEVIVKRLQLNYHSSSDE